MSPIVCVSRLKDARRPTPRYRPPRTRRPPPSSLTAGREGKDRRGGAGTDHRQRARRREGSGRRTPRRRPERTASRVSPLGGGQAWRRDSEAMASCPRGIPRFPRKRRTFVPAGSAPRRCGRVPELTFDRPRSGSRKATGPVAFATGRRRRPGSRLVLTGSSSPRGIHTVSSCRRSTWFEQLNPCMRRRVVGGSHRPRPPALRCRARRPPLGLVGTIGSASSVQPSGGWWLGCSGHDHGGDPAPHLQRRHPRTRDGHGRGPPPPEA